MQELKKLILKDMDQFFKKIIHKILIFIIPKHGAGLLAAMAIYGVILGITSINFFMLLKANLEFIYNYKFDALMDGALKQLAFLFINGYVCLMAYVCFETCKKILIKKIIKNKET